MKSKSIIYDLGTRQRAKDVLRYLRPIRGKLILDAGCGTGLLSTEIGLRGGSVIGIDILPANVILCKRKINRVKKNVEFLIADVLNLPFRNGVFDKIVSTDTLEHLENDHKACSEFSRVLKSDGYVYIHVPKKWAQQFRFLLNDVKDPFLWKKYGHVRNGYTITDLSKLLRSNNLEIIFHEETIKFFGELAWEISLTIGNIPVVLVLLTAGNSLDRLLKRRGNGLLVIAQKMMAVRALVKHTIGCEPGGGFS